ncbi:MAG: hypothetical protein ABF868_05005 [Sporolactobacillus sp.]
MANLWQIGFFANGMSGLLPAFEMTVFSFVGIELIGVTAGEAEKPEKTLPRVMNNIPIRILIFLHRCADCDHVGVPVARSQSGKRFVCAYFYADRFVRRGECHQLCCAHFGRTIM